MLESKKRKQLTKAEMERKYEAFKTLNSVLVKQSSEFTSKINSMLIEKQKQHEELKNKLEQGNGNEKDNAEYIFVGGYVQCLKDILGVKN